ncbi:hypothetical protein JXA02_06920 [candidate division KSB1 bacterium]|nr:hypothetical protein [candidate division KSB1 bacterium]RQW06783.1 MAG: hypothetical protein EH222_08075 [candidate division KSB1 bacterium]
MKSVIVKSIALSLALIVPFYFTCSDQPSEPKKQQPPAIPPLSSMTMDFSHFTTTSLAKSQAKSNWLWAASHVAVWNTVLTVTLAVPVAAFAESFNHTPILLPDGRWLWSYNYNLGTLQYTAELYGKVSLEGLEWNMFITQHGLYTDFHWFSGKSDLPATTGFWTMNLRPLEPTPFLQIDWQRDPDDQSMDIKYTNIVPGDENGSYIYQAFNQELPYTGRYDIYRVSSQNMVQIRWNRETLEGRVQDPAHFNDSDWHCWDSELDDVECD